MGDDFGLGRVGLEAVGSENGAVVGFVGLAEIERHKILVIEVGKRRVGVFAADNENHLRRLRYFLAQRRSGTKVRPRESVVNKFL